LPIRSVKLPNRHAGGGRYSSMELPRLKEYWKYNFTQTFWNLYLIKNPLGRLMGIDFSKIKKMNK